ncbi:zinc ribbon domain-containing protein [Apilactobacillus kunkeei]|uniref:zinc ribbon domain-containing protein n=1 Tax=Apilactobacillus kunkeei TaxID=148814 RepID=UPI00110CC917|nr:zinc ribbon domain-containing protein [Apilactobacillus kunkeei]TMS99108.1 zinc ribbon domain-containing protein [Apilactobacillus kunkeei]
MSAKFCPKCGNELKEGAKFCPKCGAQIVQNVQQNGSNTDGAQNQNFVQNQSTEQAKNYAKDFFKWFWGSVKHPSLSGKAPNKYFGLTSFITSVVLAILSVMLITSKINGDIDLASSSVGGDAASSISSLFQNLVSDGAGKIELFSVLMIVAFIALAYGFRAFAVTGTGEKTDFFEFMNKLAAYTNISVMLSAIMFVFVLIGGLVALPLNMFIFLFVVINDLIGFTYAIIDGQNSNKFDKLYVLLLAYLSLIIVFFIIFFKSLTA